jgi:hypothetical protein
MAHKWPTNVSSVGSNDGTSASKARVFPDALPIRLLVMLRGDDHAGSKGCGCDQRGNGHDRFMLCHGWK